MAGLFDDILAGSSGSATNKPAGLFDDIVPPEPATPKPSSGLMRRAIADQLLVPALKGAIAVPETIVGLADIPTFGAAGKLAEAAGIRFKEAREVAESMYSPEQQAINREVAQAKGVLPTIGAALRNPSVIAQGVVEALPTMFGGGLLGRAAIKGATAMGKTLPGWAAGGIGEGAVTAGQNIEQVRQQTESGYLTPGQIALGVGSGALTAGISAGGGKLAQRWGLIDPETLIAGGAPVMPVGKKPLGLMARVAGGALAEGPLQEAPQSYQEQVAQNLALGKPWSEGAGEAAALGGLIGGVIGGGTNVFKQVQTVPKRPMLPERVATDYLTERQAEIDAADQAAVARDAARAAEEVRQAELAEQQAQMRGQAGLAMGQEPFPPLLPAPAPGAPDVAINVPEILPPAGEGGPFAPTIALEQQRMADAAAARAESAEEEETYRDLFMPGAAGGPPGGGAPPPGGGGAAEGAALPGAPITPADGPIVRTAKLGPGPEAPAPEGPPADAVAAAEKAKTDEAKAATAAAAAAAAPPKEGAPAAPAPDLGQVATHVSALQLQIDTLRINSAAVRLTDPAGADAIDRRIAQLQQDQLALVQQGVANASQITSAARVGEQPQRQEGPGQTGTGGVERVEPGAQAPAAAASEERLADLARENALIEQHNALVDQYKEAEAARNPVWMKAVRDRIEAVRQERVQLGHATFQKAQAAASVQREREADTKFGGMPTGTRIGMIGHEGNDNVYWEKTGADEWTRKGMGSEQVTRRNAQMEGIREITQQPDATRTAEQLAAQRAHRQATRPSVDNPLVFNSGMSRAADFTKLIENEASAGISMKELSEASIPKLAQLLGSTNTSRVFVDTGAFSTPDIDFKNIFERYDRLARAVSEADEARGGEAVSRLYLVMPDVVKAENPQQATLDVIRQHAAEIQQHLQYGPNQTIVSIPGGSMTPVQFFDELRSILGPHDVTIGIPSANEDVMMSNAQLTELLKERGGDIGGIHLLGLASGERLNTRLAAIKAAGYDGDVTVDATRLRAIMTGGTTRAEAMAQMAAPTTRPEPGKLPKINPADVPNPVNNQPPPKDVSPDERLLLIACSEKKVPVAGKVPAWKLYHGPMWQTLRKQLGNVPPDQWPRIFLLSGKHGLIEVNAEIGKYDVKITKAKVDQAIKTGAGDIATEIGDVPIKDVMIAGTGDYNRAFHAFVTQLKAAGFIAPDASINQVKTTGPKGAGVGYMRSDLGAWLGNAVGIPEGGIPEGAAPAAVETEDDARFEDALALQEDLDQLSDKQIYDAAKKLGLKPTPSREKNQQKLANHNVADVRAAIGEAPAAAAPTKEQLREAYAATVTKFNALVAEYKQADEPRRAELRPAMDELMAQMDQLKAMNQAGGWRAARNPTAATTNFTRALQGRRGRRVRANPSQVEITDTDRAHIETAARAFAAETSRDYETVRALTERLLRERKADFPTSPEAAGVESLPFVFGSMELHSTPGVPAVTYVELDRPSTKVKINALPPEIGEQVEAYRTRERDLAAEAGRKIPEFSQDNTTAPELRKAGVSAEWIAQNGIVPQFSFKSQPLTFDNPVAGNELLTKATGKTGAALTPAGVQFADQMAEEIVNEVRAVRESAARAQRAAAGGARSTPESQTRIRIAEQAHWYSRMRVLLRKMFGAAGDTMADLLGATSARTPVAPNWAQALEALERSMRGDYDTILQTFKAHIEGGGNTKNYQGDLALRASGKKFNANTMKVMGALINQFRLGDSPKTPNYAMNLIGALDDATIDVWAARTLARIRNALYGDSPMIPSPAEGGVSGMVKYRSGQRQVSGQFFLGQQVFDRAAKQLRMKPHELQALLWFMEKDLWTRAGMTSAVGEGGDLAAEARRVPTERAVAGFAPAEQADVEASKQALAQVAVFAQQADGTLAVVNSYGLGLYTAPGGTQANTLEKSAGFEAVFRAGTSEATINEIAAQVMDAAKANDQGDAFLARTLPDGHAAGNYRPGLTVYFKDYIDAKTVNAFAASIGTANTAGGFTAFGDNNSQPGQFRGMRFIFMPEYVLDAKRVATMTPDEIAHEVVALRNETQKELLTIHDKITKRGDTKAIKIGSALVEYFQVINGTRETYEQVAAELRGENARAGTQAGNAAPMGRGGAWQSPISSSIARRAAARIEAAGRAETDRAPGRAEGAVTEDEGLLRRVRSTAERWYSALKQAIPKAPWSKAGELGPQALQQWIDARTKDGTFKRDEVEWSGLRDFITAQTGKVSRDELIAFLEQNGVQVTETELGKTDPPPGFQLTEPTGPNGRYKLQLVNVDAYGLTASDAAYALQRKLELMAQNLQRGGDEKRAMRMFGYAESLNDYIETAAGHGGPGTTKHAGYQLPGGKDYRELLLTLPAKLPNGWRVERWNTSDDRYPDTRPQDPDTRYQVLDEKGDQRGIGATAQDAINDAGTGERKSTFTGGHYGEYAPNVLAHIRFNERTDADGKRVLFIEEIQSDWAQKGRKAGFRPNLSMADAEKLDRETAQARAAYDEVYKELSEKYGVDRSWDVERLASKEDKARFTTAHEAFEAKRQEWARAAGNAGIPSAPFVGKTEVWTALAMKRMIRYAAENGFDRVAWTTGEQQAERYDLSKQLDQITAKRDKEGKYNLGVTLKDGKLMPLVGLSETELGDHIGKEMADRIVKETADNTGTHVYNNLDLKVGGEGMQAFYDRIVPNVANDVLKKLGGGRVSEVRLGRTGDEFDNVDVGKSTDNQWYHYDARGYMDTERNWRTEAEARAALPANLRQPGFDITPELREKALQPMPMFAKDYGAVRPAQVHAKANTQVSAEVDGLTARLTAEVTHLSALIKQRMGINRPNEKQRGILAAAIQDLVGNLGVPAARLAPLHVFQDREGEGDARYHPIAQTIGVNEQMLTHIGRVTGSTPWASTLRSNIAHESRHHEDNDGKGNFASVNSPLFAIDMNAEGIRQPTGPLIREAAVAWSQDNGELKLFLEYPMRHWNDPDGTHGVPTAQFLQEEMYAQLGSLYDTNPALLRSTMPGVFKLFQEINYATANARSIDEVRRGVREAFRQASTDLRATAPGRQAAAGADRARAVQRGTGEGMGEAGDRGRDTREAEPVATSEESGFRFVRTPAWVTATPQRHAALQKLSIGKVPPTLGQRMTALFANAGLRATQNLVDQFRALKDLPDDERAYMLARLTKGSSAALEAMLHYGTINLNSAGAVAITPEKGGFIGIMRQLGGEHDRFLAWIAGNRAEELKKPTPQHPKGRENLLTAGDISNLKDLNQGQMPDGSSRAMLYAKIHAEMNRYNKTVLDLAEKAGTINAADRALWEKDFYVPFYRVLEEGGYTGPHNVSGLANQSAIIKKLQGGTQDTRDLMANMLHNWNMLIGKSLHNQAAQAALDAAFQMGPQGNMGVAYPIKSHEAAKGDPFVLVDGRKQYWRVEDPFVLQAITAIEPSPFTGAIPRMMGKFKHALTVGVTISPTFRVNNLLRDSLMAIGVNDLSYNILKNLNDGRLATNKDNPLYAMMLAGGGLMHFGTGYESDTASHAKALIKAGIKGANVLDTREKLTLAWKRAWDWWEETGSRTENVNRAAIYKQAVDKALAAGKSQDEAHLLGAYAARDSMDFSLQGASGTIRFLSQVVPFFNARAQGMYKLGREGFAPATRVIYNTVTGKPIEASDAAKAKRFGAVVGGVTLAGIALYLLNRGDPDFEEREEWDRDGFWWFKIGDHAMRIPKPFEVGALASLAERSLELMMSDMSPADQKRFGKALGGLILNNLSMNPIPQIAKPAIDVWSNTNMYTGRPIETQGMERLSKAERVGSRTSVVAQQLGKVTGPTINLSPVQIDSLVQGYLGWLGAHAVLTADLALRPLTGAPGKPALRIDDIVVAGDFVKSLPAQQSRYMTEFYDQAVTAQQALADYRHALALGQLEKVRDIAESEREEIARAPRFAKAQSMLSMINTRIRAIEASDVSADEKREQLDRLTQQKNRLAQSVVTMR